jgi:hypothetical protein
MFFLKLLDVFQKLLDIFPRHTPVSVRGVGSNRNVSHIAQIEIFLYP